MPSPVQGLSPRIEVIRWGVMRIEGVGEGKDYKLYPGGGRAWDWRETGTKHDPGIQVADVEELLERGSEIIVLSRGMQQRLLTRPETLSWLRDQAVEVIVDETRAAAERYNALVAEGRAVGGLFHSTC